MPESFALDADRVARFTREAQVLASLNHPNIAAIYGLEEVRSGGPSGPPSHALVMELVEGQDLSELIGGGTPGGPEGPPLRLNTQDGRSRGPSGPRMSSRGPSGPRAGLSLADALPIAKQIADALEAAHEQGIVHRDLKPQNIKVRADGTVKVLDFGLAKAMDRTLDSGPGTLDPRNSPTMTSPAMTGMGMILGTAAYMSPEQAKGRAVDRRADIWAFGVVLYEMLTGRRAFEGEDVSELLVAVLSKDVDLAALPVTTPPAIVSLIRRCLVRDPKNRLRDIGEARLALAADVNTQIVATAPSSEKLPWLVAAGATLALLAFAAWTFSSRAVPTESRAIVTTLLPPANGEFAFTVPYAMPAISPDGTRVVYGAKDQSGKQQLWLRQLDSSTARALPGTEDAATPFWAPDSRWVGFGQGNKLKKIDVQGGPPVAVADLPSALRGGSWNSQGVIVAGVVSGGKVNSILRVAASGGTAVAIAGTDGRHPWFLPDGRHFLYQKDREVRVGDLNEAGTSGKAVAETDSPAVYSEGHLLYLRVNTLMAQPFDAGRLETTGDAVSVADGIPTFTSGSRIPGFAVSPAGLLLYQSGGAGTKSLLVWKDRQGKQLGALPEARIVSHVALSPDGTRVAVAQWELGTPAGDLWIYALDRGMPTRFTSSPENDVDPVWSPDSALIYFSSNPNGGPYKIFRKPSNGAGKVDLVLEDSASVFPSGISPDGKLLLYRGSGAALRALPLNGTSGDRQAKPSELPEIRASRPVEFSPDGRWLVYDSVDGVYAAPFPGPGTRIQISRRGGSTPRWGKDGKEIFFANADRTLMAVDVAVRNGTLQAGEPRALFGGIVTSSTGAGAGITYDASRDSQRILVFDDGASTTAQPLTLVQHWTALLRGAAR